MKRIILLIPIFVLIILSSAFASDDYIKIRYLPGYPLPNSTMRIIDVVISEPFRGDDEVIIKVYNKLKEIETLGRLDYAVLDAPLISIEVKYNGEIIKSAKVNYRIEDKDMARFQELWEEAYSLVWNALEKELKPKPN